MDTVERFRAVFEGRPVDRPPVCGWIGLPLLERLMGASGAHAVLEAIVEDPLTVVQVQEDLGLDPILVTVDDRWFSMHHYWRMLYSLPDEAADTWRVQARSEPNGDFTRYHFTATTPGGDLTWSYDVGGYQVGELERPVKTAADVELLARYMPAPELLDQTRLTELVARVGSRAFVTHNFIGVWGEAANMRGLVDLCTDLYDQPELVHRLSDFLAERSIRRVRHAAETGLHSILYDQSWVGVGLSPTQYREFIQPYDMRVVAAAREAGLLISYHNCGRGRAILDDMVDVGAHALETLTPKEGAGDFDLREVKARVGDRITLNGGFNERVLAESTPQQARDAARRCLEVAAPGGRYILRTTGQMFDAAPGTIEAVAEAAREYAYDAR